MSGDCSEYRVPSFAKREVYDFDAAKDALEVYEELTAISKEIEECRLKNC